MHTATSLAVAEEILAVMARCRVGPGELSKRTGLSRTYLYFRFLPGSDMRRKSFTLDDVDVIAERLATPVANLLSPATDHSSSEAIAATRG